VRGCVLRARRRWVLRAWLMGYCWWLVDGDWLAEWLGLGLGGY
jgi:hypothetical protein